MAWELTANGTGSDIEKRVEELERQLPPGYHAELTLDLRPMANDANRRKLADKLDAQLKDKGKIPWKGHTRIAAYNFVTGEVIVRWAIPSTEGFQTGVAVSGTVIAIVVVGIALGICWAVRTWKFGANPGSGGSAIPSPLMSPTGTATLVIVGAVIGYYAWVRFLTKQRQ